MRCARRHSFDVARQGYASLLTGARATSGDDATMAAARERFLATGAYRPLRDAVVALATADRPGAVLDVGCGTGWYLAGVLDAAPRAVGLGLDTSSRSLRRAARAHERAAAVASDVLHHLPLVDDAVDVVLDVFSPRNPGEWARVLRPGGRVVLARPGAGHLAELRAAVPRMVAVDPAKEDRLHAALGPTFAAGVTERVHEVVALAETAARDLVTMTPSGRHVSSADLADRADLPATVTLDVLVTAYTPR